MKKVIAIVLAIAIISSGVGVAMAGNDGNGNGAPSGAHFNLNIIGKDKEMDIDNCGNGHRIFVPLGDEKNTKTARILLQEGDFAVIDCDGTDGQARFQLPNPDPGDGSMCTAYSVYIRPLGKPNGKAKMSTCATDPLTGEEVCSIEVVDLTRIAGKQKFTNVSKELLTICAEICTEVDPVTGECIAWEWMRLYLFDPILQDYLWKYDNNGLKIAQLRFYPQETCYAEDEWACKGNGG
jgi:hypothetical protein